MDDILLIPQTELLITDDLVLEQIEVKDRELLIETVFELLEPAVVSYELLDLTPDALVLEVGIQGPPGANGSSADVPHVTFPTASFIDSNRAVRLTTGLVSYATSSALPDANLVLGVTRSAAASGAPVQVQTGGLMENPGWAWVADQPIFCGIGGALTQSAPAAGFRLVLGIALSATQIHIGLRTPIVLT